MKITKSADLIVQRISQEEVSQTGSESSQVVPVGKQKVIRLVESDGEIDLEFARKYKQRMEKLLKELDPEH